jgi:hypothetical protein
MEPDPKDDDLEFEVEETEISEGRKLYVFTFPEPTEGP